MISFKKKDLIEHPTYGLGQITKVTAVKDGLSVLDVTFDPSGIQKQFNSQWVEKNCRHTPYVPATKSTPAAHKDGVYTEDPSLATGLWRVFPESDTQHIGPWPDSIRFLLNNITPGINFAQIEKAAVVVLEPEEGTSLRQIEEAARKHMRAVFRHHPDFECVQTDDGGLVLLMQQGHLWQFVPPQKVQRRPNGEISLQTLLSARVSLMDACSIGKIYAIVRSDLPTENAD